VRNIGCAPALKERHRQLKCFSDLAGFTSRRFSLVVNQVVFVLLMYSLLQWYWQRIRRPEFNPRTTARALEQLRPTMSVILIFYQGYVARLAPLEYQELLLTLKEEARLKILAKTRRLRRGLSHQLRPRSGSLDSLRIQKCALENLSRPRQGYTFLLPCKSFALVTRDIRAASLSPASNQFFAY